VSTVRGQAQTSTRSAGGPPGTDGPPAHAFLAVATAVERDQTPTPAGLIELTVNEFRHLYDALPLTAAHTVHALLAWSRWRRRHQARTRQCHYKRREDQ
jgi:hypothetical protein